MIQSIRNPIDANGNSIPLDTNIKNPITSVANNLSAIIAKSAFGGASAYAFATVYNNALTFIVKHITPKVLNYVSSMNRNLAVTCGVVALATFGLCVDKKSNTYSKIVGISTVAFAALQACRFNLVFKLADLIRFGHVTAANNVHYAVNFRQVAVMTAVVGVFALVVKKTYEFVSSTIRQEAIEADAKLAAQRELSFKKVACLNLQRGFNKVGNLVDQIYI